MVDFLLWVLAIVLGGGGLAMLIVELGNAQ